MLEKEFTNQFLMEDIRQARIQSIVLHNKKILSPTASHPNSLNSFQESAGEEKFNDITRGKSQIEGKDNLKYLGIINHVGTANETDFFVTDANGSKSEVIFGGNTKKLIVDLDNTTTLDAFKKAKEELGYKVIYEKQVPYKYNDSSGKTQTRFFHLVKFQNKNGKTFDAIKVPDMSGLKEDINQFNALTNVINDKFKGKKRPYNEVFVNCNSGLSRSVVMAATLYAGQKCREEGKLDDFKRHLMEAISRRHRPIFGKDLALEDMNKNAIITLLSSTDKDNNPLLNNIQTNCIFQVKWDEEKRHFTDFLKLNKKIKKYDERCRYYASFISKNYPDDTDQNLVKLARKSWLEDFKKHWAEQTPANQEKALNALKDQNQKMTDIFKSSRLSRLDDEMQEYLRERAIDFLSDEYRRQTFISKQEAAKKAKSEQNEFTFSHI